MSAIGTVQSVFHCRRDSFVRFGDDLSQLLLSYLPLKDKFGFESVSKQWKRLIFNGQTVLIVGQTCKRDQMANNLPEVLHSFNDQTIYHKLVDDDKLAKVLKKCRNIRTISFVYPGINKVETIGRPVMIGNAVVSAIIDNCQRLDSIGLDMTRLDFQYIARFGAKFGQNLKALAVHDNTYERTRCLVRFCPNLRSIAGNNLYLKVVDSSRFVTKLERIGRLHSDMTDYEVKTFDRFITIKGKQLKHMSAKLSNWSSYDIDGIAITLEQMTRLSNIEVLVIKITDLSLEATKRFDLLVPKFAEIGSKCKQLKRLSLSIQVVCDLDKIFKWSLFKAIGQFRKLKNLKIKCYHLLVEDSKEVIEPLMDLKKLKIRCQTIGNNFFSDITRLAPNMERLEFYANHKISKDSLIRLSGSALLKRLTLGLGLQSSVDDSVVIQLFDNCKNLDKIKFLFKANITIATIDKLVSLANGRPKRVICFECYVTDDRLLPNRLTNIPKNLIIKTRKPFPN